KSCKISKKTAPAAQKTVPKPLSNRQGCDILPPITHLCRPCDCAARVRGGRTGPKQRVEKTRRVNPNGSYLHEAAPGSGRALRSPDPPLEPQDGSVHFH